MSTPPAPSAPPGPNDALTGPGEAHPGGRPSGWWYVLAPALLAAGTLVAGVVVLVALGAAGRSMADQPVIGVADTAVVEVRTPGEFVVFARYAVPVEGRLVDEPQVVVLDPAGGGLRLAGPAASQAWSVDDGELVALGTVTTTRSGPHRVVVGPVATDLVTGVVVTPDPLAGVVAALGWALGIAVVSAVAAVVAVVAVALRRRRRTGELNHPRGVGLT